MMTYSFLKREPCVWFMYTHIKWLCVFIILTENKTQPKIGFICLFVQYNLRATIRSWKLALLTEIDFCLPIPNYISQTVFFRFFYCAVHLNVYNVCCCRRRRFFLCHFLAWANHLATMKRFTKCSSTDKMMCRIKSDRNVYMCLM